MMFVNIPNPPNLPARWLSIYPKRIQAAEKLATNDLRSDYFRKNNSWGLLKNWLSSIGGQKCWYCEAKCPRATFDVDHFRPKLGVTVDRVALTGHIGYYWLAYEWSNFRLSCQRCNRPEKSHSGTLLGKANEFPIRDEARRCSSPAGSLDTESPKLLDPCVQADCDLLADGIDGEVKPRATDKSWEYDRAKYTIDLLGFNEVEVLEEKRRQWQRIALLINLAGNSSNSAIINMVEECLSPSHEYTSFFRSAIGTHRDKPWVEALL